MSDTPDIPELLELNDRFLHATDLQKVVDGGVTKWAEFSLTIERVHPAGSLFQEDANGKKGQAIPHQALQFKQTEKMLILTSKINKRRLKALFGNTVTGNNVTLYPVFGTWFGIPGTLGIRVRPGRLKLKEDRKDVGADLTGQVVVES